MNQHQTLTTATRQQILAEYDRGDDCNEIAARHGVSRSVVTMSAHRAGISRSNRTEVSPVRLIYGQWVWTRGIARWVPYVRQGVSA